MSDAAPVPKITVVKGTPQAPSKFLVMGDPFTGKTTLASKAPKPLFLSTDGNALKAGLDSVMIESLETLREAIPYFVSSDYETVVIDTIEGIADLYYEEVLQSYISKGARNADGSELKSLADIPYGRGTAEANAKLQRLAEALGHLKKNVIILSYTKKKQDEATNSLVLDSELKNIRQFTKFMDAQILTSFDGEHYRAQVVHKREIAAGEVDYSHIREFLVAAGWDLPRKKVRIGDKR